MSSCPEEISNFVKIGLQERWPTVKVIEQSDGTTVVRIPSDEQGIRALMVGYLERREEKNTRAWRAIGRAGGGQDWIVTFDPDVAKRNHELDFITLHHPLVGALLKAQLDRTRPTVALRVKDDTGEGRFAFFLYLLRIHSFKQALEFLPIAVEIGGDVDEEISDLLLSRVQSAETWSGTEPYATDDELDLAASTATAWVTDRIEERRIDLERVSDQILNRRIESMSDSHSRWMEHRSRLLDDAEARGQDSIARLHRGFMRRRQAETEAKLAELEGQKGVEIGHELVAGGLLAVVPSAAPTQEKAT